MPKIHRQDINLKTNEVLIITGPDGSRITLMWSKDLKGYEVGLQMASGESMCPYLAVLPNATNTVTLSPRER